MDDLVTTKTVMYMILVNVSFLHLVDDLSSKFKVNLKFLKTLKISWSTLGEDGEMMNLSSARVTASNWSLFWTELRLTTHSILYSGMCRTINIFYQEKLRCCNLIQVNLVMVFDDDSDTNVIIIGMLLKN